MKEVLKGKHWGRRGAEGPGSGAAIVFKQEKEKKKKRKEMNKNQNWWNGSFLVLQLVGEPV